jgi:hypothetical protein
MRQLLYGEKEATDPYRAPLERSMKFLLWKFDIRSGDGDTDHGPFLRGSSEGDLRGWIACRARPGGEEVIL